MQLIQRITNLKKELDKLRPLDAETEAAIMQKFRLDWNFHSNNLEGNTLTYGETRALILFGVTASGKPLKDHFEITGHDEAIKWIEDVVMEERLLTENFIRQLHTLILKEPYYKKAQTSDGQSTKKLVHVGEYKKEPNHVETMTGEIFRFATPEEMPAKMHDFIEWYRAKKEALHPLLLAAEFHYKFIRIHPFDDGNGRTARLLMNFILLQNGYPPVVIRTDDKENYFAVLRQADAGNLEPFVEYIGENLEHSLTLMLKGARGESIDEADDVDKEIALLERRLEDINFDIQKTKSPEIVEFVFKKTIQPLFLEYLKACRKFEKLYKNIRYTFVIGGAIREQGYSYNAVLKSIRQTNHISWDMDQCWIKCSFNDFNGQKIDSFSFKSNIGVEFKEPYYTILGNHSGQLFSKMYHQYLSTDEIQQIIRSETKAHTDFISQKIEEAQESDS